jgi:hypothetical protein
MLGAIREVQIPLLAAMLLGGCGAKALRVLRARDMAVGLGPTSLFPLRLRRPVAMFMCGTELALGLGLVVTSTRFAASPAATAIRAGVVVLFLIAVGALVELRERRPGAGCGCFGDLSVTPVGLRTITRSALLALAAISAIGQPGLHMPASGSAAGLRLGFLAAELLLIAALSPEIGEAMVRLGYSEPCEVRRLSVTRTLSSLTGSPVWRRHAHLITSAAPSDVWREGCWRYVVYPGEAEGRGIDVIFAVYLRARRPQIRAAVLDAVTDEVIAGPNVPGWEPGNDLGFGWPMAQPAGTAGPGGPGGRHDMLPGLAARRPVSAPGAAGPLTRAGAPARADDTLVTGGAGALHFAAPAYTRNGPPYTADGPDPVAYAMRRSGPAQRPEHQRPEYPHADYKRADYGHGGRKPENHARKGPRPPRHRSSANF